MTTLRVHVGGGSDKLGIATGIHWHMNVANVVEYIATDDAAAGDSVGEAHGPRGQRARVSGRGRARRTQLAKGERRRMDCVDCHNRPSHPFDATTEQRRRTARIAHGRDSGDPAVHPARSDGRAQSDVPVTSGGATDAIAARLREFYRRNYTEIYMGRRQDVERGVPATQPLFKRNVFPAMNVTWGTLPEQHRPHGLSRLLPVSRREPQDEGRQDDRADVRFLPRHSVERHEQVR